jgi:peptidoglycan hydrolase CwlO-like protein
MKRILVLAPLLILLIFGSACNVPIFETSTPKASPKVSATIKAMLEAERHQLKDYEEKLRDTENQIIGLQGRLDNDESDRLLAARDNLKQRILQSRVNIRELEILLNEED